VSNPVRSTAAFDSVKSRLRQLPPAPSTEDATRNAGNRAPSGESRGGVLSGNVQRPSSSYKKYSVGDILQVSVPSNWRELPGNSSVTFAPEGAYGTAGQQSVFTHGVEAGVARNETHDLQTATEELIQSLAQANPRLTKPSGFSRTTIGNREGLRTLLSNVSDATGRPERIELFTTTLQDGTLFYLIGVAPDAEFESYQPVFRRVAGSVQLTR
jgi:hypothetical protein